MITFDYISRFIARDAHKWQNATVIYSNLRKFVLFEMNKVGARLKEVRKDMGLNQEEFALLGKAGRVAQFQYESGQREPKLSYLESLSSHGVDTLYILFGVRSGEPLTIKVDSLDESILDEAIRFCQESKLQINGQNLLHIARAFKRVANLAKGEGEVGP